MAETSVKSMNAIAEKMGLPYQKLNSTEELQLDCFLRFQSPELIDYITRNKEMVLDLAEILKAFYDMQIGYAEAGKLHLNYSLNKPRSKYGLVIGTGNLNGEIIRVDHRLVDIIFRVEKFMPIRPTIVTVNAETSLGRYDVIILQFYPWHLLMQDR